MASTALLHAILFLACAADNLLANPSFEETAVDLPARWDLYLKPHPGATGKLVGESHTGDLSVFLHTPTPYDRDPVNNWSQNIIAEIAGQTLHLSGYIKVQEAKEGALWVQCWRRQPWGVLKAITTSTDAPIYGTKEWEQVEITLEVPQGTDFITVRCVLLGTGAAWFDDISIAKTKPVKSESTPEDSEADDATKEDSALPEEASPEETVVINTTEDSEDIKKVEAELARFRQANLLLAEGVQGIQSSNKELLEEILRLQIQLEKLRGQVSQAAMPPPQELEPLPAPVPVQDTALPPVERVPILIPHQNNRSTPR
jgi:hypothetical protein